MTNIQIRKISLIDVWQIRHTVMYPAETFNFIKLEDDDMGLHWGLYVEELLVSVISLFDKGNNVQFRKFATVSAMQGKGYGSELLKYAMDWSLTAGKKTIWCNARIVTTELYMKFGMKPVGESWEKYGIEFIKMEKQLA